jgi:hypothetical protein
LSDKKESESSISSDGNIEEINNLNDDNLDFTDKNENKTSVAADKLSKLKLEKASYTFWTEKDKDKLNSFR